MLIKKWTALLATVIITAAFSACGIGGAEIPISRISFGMSENQVKAVVSAKTDNAFSDPAFPVYVGTNDIDEAVTSCMFAYDDCGLYEIYMLSDDMPCEECFAARDRLVKNLSAAYGVPESDWETESDGYKNFLNYRNEDGQLIRLYIRLYNGVQDDSASITLIFKSYDDIPVIPKN